MTDNPTPNEAALTAAELVAKVEEGWDRAESESRAADNEWNEHPMPNSDITEGRAAFRLLLTRQQERERRYRELLTILEYRISKGHWQDVEYYLPQITALLAELGGDESAKKALVTPYAVAYHTDGSQDYLSVIYRDGVYVTESIAVKDTDKSVGVKLRIFERDEEAPTPPAGSPPAQ